MNFKSIWDKICKHNVWSKVAASSIYALIFAICGFISSLIANGNFTLTSKSFFSLVLPLSICIFILVGVLLTFRVYKGKVLQTIEDGVESNSSRLMLPKVSPHLISKADNIVIFDMNIDDGNSWPGPGRSTGYHFREKGVGNGGHLFQEGILTIAGSAGPESYSITLKDYFYDQARVTFIPRNLHGKNPRSFLIIFHARAISGEHSIQVKFKRNSTYVEETKSIVFEIKSPEWRINQTIMEITCDIDFFVELNAISSGLSKVQIKDLVIIQT